MPPVHAMYPSRHKPVHIGSHPSGYWALLVLLVVPPISAQTEAAPSSSKEQRSEIQWQYIGMGVFTGFLVIGITLICLQLYRMRRESGENLFSPLDRNREMPHHQQTELTTPNHHVVNISFLDTTFPTHLYYQDDHDGTVKRTAADHSQQPKTLHTLLENRSDLTCAICLEDFVNKVSLVRKLGCKHIFHASCIDRWLTTRSTLCPLCKYSCIDGDSSDDYTTIDTATTEEPPARTTGTSA